MAETPNGSGSEEYAAGVRLVVLNLPEDEGEGLGFRLTRTLWDPYPWVREVTPGARADTAGLKTGDCILQADGKDLLGLPVGQIAGLIRGDGAGRGVSLLVWNCGVDPKDDPELLWSCGGGSRGERSRRALAGVVKALSCCVCAATTTRALNCARSHLYCESCWCRLKRCALCREALPSKDSPYARNLVAEQVFEAIATEYELKNAIKQPMETASAYASPNRSPNASPAVNRRGQYQLSMMNKTKKTVQFNQKFGQNYASDPNIHRSLNSQEFIRRIPTVDTNSTNLVENSEAGNSNMNTGKSCNCQNVQKSNQHVQTQNTNIGDNNTQINKQNDESVNKCGNNIASCSQNCHNLLIQHKLLARLRAACSLADLQNSAVQNCNLTRSLNNISLGNHCLGNEPHSGSLDNLKNNSNNACDSPLLLLPAPPIYVLSCDHNKN